MSTLCNCLKDSFTKMHCVLANLWLQKRANFDKEEEVKMFPLNRKACDLMGFFLNCDLKRVFLNWDLMRIFLSCDLMRVFLRVCMWQ